MTERRTPPILYVGDRLQAEPHKVRQRVLEILDEMSVPMSRQQIEDALLTAGGFSRAERRKLAQALKCLPIIAIGAGQWHHSS
jgi:hypothetical protein